MLSLKKSLLTVSAVALFSGSAFAYTFESSTLYDQTDGNVTYVTGGIGENEVMELEEAKSEYNFRLTNTDKGGAYVSDTSIIVQDRKGNDVLATNTGPMLLAKLPAGKYTVMAENQGIVQKKTINVGTKKAANLQLHWNLPE